MTKIGDALHPCDERLCPLHQRELARYERTASNRAAILAPLAVWLVAGLASVLLQPGGTSKMLELVSFVAFWGGFVARIVCILWRLMGLFRGLLRCEACRASLRERSSINRR